MVGFFRYGLQYGDYLLEIALLGVVVYRSFWRRRADVFLFLASLVAIDVVFRPVVLYRYGVGSHEYFYTYWLSNITLQLAAFLLVCSFFRSACLQNQKTWHVLRLALPTVFLLMVAISGISIWHKYSELSTSFNFINELSQYLYFACLVLNTLLFIMMQYVEVADDHLSMLVCGLGLQFAGPAAGMAVVVLAHGQQYAREASGFIEQLCTLGMLATWLYAVTRVSRTAPRPVREEPGIVEQAA